MELEVDILGMPEISIIMPVYNGEAYLASAIKSVQAQTFPGWELLVIDDGSLDKSREIVEGFAKDDERVKLLHRTENQGLVYSLNEGLAAASGEFIARLDSDDRWSDPGKLLLQKDFLRANSQVGLLGAWGQIIKPDGQPVRKLTYPVSDSQIRREILIHNCFIHSSIFARRRLMLDCGGYNPAESLVEDYGLWLRMGLKAQFYNLPRIMVEYRLTPLGLTRSQNSRQVKQAAGLVSRYGRSYPNSIAAKIKWAIQRLL